MVSHSGHKIVKCSCGRVIMQCRCPDFGDKTVEIRAHPACGLPALSSSEPLLFLDIDGVLCNLASQQGKHGRNHLKMPLPAPECIAALQRIMEATKPIIVVTSTWRLGGWTAKQNTLKWLRAAGIKGRIGFTQDYSRWEKTLYIAVSRGEEIAAWLKGREHYPFVILDDDNDMGELSDHLVRTNPQIGLTMQDAERAIQLLTQEEPA